MSGQDMQELRLQISRLLNSKTITNEQRQDYLKDQKEDIDILIEDHENVIKELIEQRQRVSVKIQN